MRRTDSTRAFSQLVVLVALICGIATLFFARAILVPFALALLFAFLLTPVVRLLDRIHVPRAASSVGVVTVTVIALGLLGWVVAGQVLEVASQLPSYRLNIKRRIGSLRGQDIHKAANAVNEIGKELVTQESAPSVSAKPNNLGGTSMPAGSPGKPLPVEVIPPVTNPLESLNSLIGPISTFCIVAVFTLFMLIRREDLRNRFIRLIGHQHLNTLTQALDDASSRVSRYLLLQVAVNAGYGLIVATGLYFIGIPHVLLWGVLAALLRFVPYVGSLLSSVLPILLSLAMFDDWTRPLLTLLLYAVAELIIGNVVEPLLYAAHVGLSSLAILVAAVFWTVLWGPVGLVLSTPLTVCLVVIGRYVPDLGFLNVVLGDEPVLSPESHFYQRLLASDQHEAKLVLEGCLKDKNLSEVYDTVLIPALALAEQDRHRNDLDEATQQFINLSTKEAIEDLYEKSSELASQSSRGTDDKSLEGGVRSPDPISPGVPHAVTCVPARDDADEIVGTMLSQLLEQVGHRSESLSIGTIAEMITILEDAKPDVICISALPPLAFSHARNLYLRLRPLFPEVKILIGLWGFSGDTAKITHRMRLSEGDGLFVSLRQVLAEIDGRGEIPEDKASEVPVPSPSAPMSASKT